jgi:predicted phage gp36 major capsid-like protein
MVAGFPIVHCQGMRGARSKQRQVLCVVLYDQASGGGVQDFDAIKVLKFAVS